MPITSPALYYQVRNTLLRCGPFADDAQLRTLLAHPWLQHWQEQLQERLLAESNVIHRVNITIDFLYGNSYPITRENALVILLRVLATSTPIDEDCRYDLRLVI